MSEIRSFTAGNPAAGAIFVISTGDPRVFFYEKGVLTGWYERDTFNFIKATP